MQNKWNFPYNGFGQVRGISDAGIENFNGTELKSLAREICQNSLDAIKDNSKAVTVEFEVHNINNSYNIPGYFEYKDKIEKAIFYWKNNEKASNYLNKAKIMLESSESYVLRISDYNTTGLKNPYSDDIQDGWNLLTKVDGGSTKSGNKGGSFGIGKNAPFSNSYYRLVFYRTLNIDNQIAAQGISRFVSFPEDINDIRNTMTMGIGYYGNPDGNYPIEKIEELEKIKERTEIGTDVFIFGFNKTEKWESELIIEILENFIVSIYKEKLCVIVNNQKIEKNTLNFFVEKYKNKLKNTYNYYKILESNEIKIFETDFKGLGTLRLKVINNQKEKLNRKVLITRNSGMKLFEKDRISSYISFTAILELEGDNLNSYFRKMENPEHNNWIPGRCEDKKEAKEYHKALFNWVKSQILSLEEYSTGDELLVEGLSDNLQMEEEDFENNINKIIIEEIPIKKEKVLGAIVEETKKGNIYEANYKGDLSQGNNGAVRNLSGTRKRKSKVSHTGNVNENGKNIIKGSKGLLIKQNLKIRLIKIFDNVIRITFTSPKDIKIGAIELVAVGENGKQNKLSIFNFEMVSGFQVVKCDKYSILFNDIKKDVKNKLDIKLNDFRNYSMEVYLYEYIKN